MEVWKRSRTGSFVKECGCERVLQCVERVGEKQRKKGVLEQGEGRVVVWTAARVCCGGGTGSNKHASSARLCVWVPLSLPPLSLPPPLSPSPL